VLATADFLEDPGTLDLTTKTPQCALERFAFANSDTGQDNHLLPAQQRTSSGRGRPHGPPATGRTRNLGEGQPFGKQLFDQESWGTRATLPPSCSSFCSIVS
jgi:hypothetical protein